MDSRNRGLERVLLALFIASGFAGLIYQSIWSHYLGLSLGHAAYAQSLVLAIFMGGMAIGAWLVSFRGVHWRRLIFAYAIVEIVIGLAGLLFHPLFLAYTGFSQDTVYPGLESVAAVRAWQWASAALLIAPQSILLGMTFPLMSGGYLRVAPGADGEILGGLYFTNSLGAAMGALFATFLLLPWIGMPGAMVTAGVINLLVGVFAWMVSRRADVQAEAPRAIVPQPSSAAGAAGSRRFYWMMIVAAAITGASSFVYEIGWVRLLNQSLGTTVHSFELMLAAFILGLAFGGLWIRKRSRFITDAVSYAGYAQVWMGVAALVSIPVFSNSFQWVGSMVDSLPKTEAGYAWFSLGSGVIALLVMFPAAFFAGMTLPLFTMALLRRGEGEASIGRIYAANTIGAIIGVVLAVHVLIPMLGLRLAVTLAAVADIVLGIALLRLFSERLATSKYIAASSVGVLAIVVSLATGSLDPRALASGVFRHGRALLEEDIQVHFLRDGKTATVSFVSRDSVGILATNGKPDASIEMRRGGTPTGDEITMAMLAVLPLAAHPDPKEVAVIGWGSGMTTHVLLGSDAPERVDTIEIERAMYDAAANFGTRVERAYRDPRSRVHFEDARTFFSTGHRKYDVIVSEPSNPWVSGVASLFTTEFYQLLGRHLKPGGVVVQWVQSYELDDPLLSTMVAALIEEFPHANVYSSNGSDLIFVLGRDPLPALSADNIAGTVLKRELAYLGITGTDALKVRQIGTRDTLAAYVALYGADPHTDFHPVVALQGPKARFISEYAYGPAMLARAGMPVLEMLGGRSPLSADSEIPVPGDDSGAKDYWIAREIRSVLAGGSDATLARLEPEVGKQLASLRRLSSGPIAESDLAEWMSTVATVADYSIGYLQPADHAGVWTGPSWIDPAQQSEVVRSVLEAYSAAAERDAPRMRASGLRALSLMQRDPSKSDAVVQEQMLVVAMLGAIGEGDLAGAQGIEKQQGAAVRVGQAYGFVRAYLLAWIETRLKAGAPLPTPSPAS